MSTFLSTLAWGFAALLAVATAVALWEYARTKASKHRVLPPAPQPGRAASLDVNLTSCPKNPPPRKATKPGARLRWAVPWAA
jgi:hypothetical protein